MPGIESARGVFDLLPGEHLVGDLPAQSHSYAWLFGRHALTAEAFGYRPIQTPIFEKTEMFERGIGAGTDVVDKEMYSFTTAGGDRLTLRPEGTPAALRAILSGPLNQESRPVRVHYGGPMFRHDKPQRGRYRQFHQVGVEVVGESLAALDAEVIEIGWRFFAALGIDGVSLQINSLGDIEDRRRYREALVTYYTPHLAELCDDCRRRLQINPLRLLDCKRDQHLAAAAPHLEASLADASRDYFAAVRGHLDEAAIPHTVNTRLVRGLDYYAHTTFEYWHTGLQGAQNALGGGGRYDGLAEVLGFPATPGVGYALGVERALIILAENGGLPPAPVAAEVVVAALGDGAAAAAAATARDLRAAGTRVILDTAARKLDKKVRQASRGGARVLVVVGEDEAAGGTATVRDLERREQTTVERSRLAATVAEIVSRPLGERI